MTQELLNWYGSPVGQRFLAAQGALAAQALSAWPARGRALLEIDCADGRLQGTLAGLGFDVTGCEASPALRAAFQNNLGSRFLVDPAHPDLLPYEDKSFHWAVLHLERGAPAMDKVLGEALRVVSKGAAVFFWNRFSLASLGNASLPLAPLSPWLVRRRLSGTASGRLRCLSALALPVRFWGSAWKDRKKTRGLSLDSLKYFLNAPMPGALGSLCLLTLELPPAAPLTATPLRVRRVTFQDRELSCGERVYEGRARLFSGLSGEKNFPSAQRTKFSPRADQ